VRIQLTTDDVDALKNGQSVKFKSANAGPDGRNGIVHITVNDERKHFQKEYLND